MSRTAREKVSQGPRNDIIRVVRDHISFTKMKEAITAPEKTRFDAICHIIRDAVKGSPLVTFSGIPHVYSKDEGYYIPFDFHEFKTAIDEILRTCDVPDGIYFRENKIIGDCWSEVMCHKSNVDTGVIVMANGVYDTLDGQLHEYSSTYHTNMKVDFEYNPNETAVGWGSFLNRVLPDVKMQMLLQEFVASTFIDRSAVKFEQCLILLGTGSNGKSVVFEVICSLLGEDNVSTFSIRDLIGTRSEQNLACANGKRLNYCSEMKTTEINEKNADSFKSLVSGEPAIARSLYREPFKACNLPVIMANANRLPRLEDATYSLQRRILVIPFDVCIPEDEQNRELASQLKDELPGIFNWALDGYRRLVNNRFRIIVPDEVKRIVESYIRDNNPVARWLDERHILAKWHPNSKAVAGFVSRSEMWRRFYEWCCDNGEEGVIKKRFFEMLNEMGFDKRRMAAGWGYTVYQAPTADDLRAAQMDNRIADQNREYLSVLKSRAEESERPKVRGVDAAEKYLGLMKESLYSYLNTGSLAGTFVVQPDGELEFDIHSLQAALAEAGYYFDLSSGGLTKQKIQATIKQIRRAFNNRMKTLGLPIRKYNNYKGTLPADAKDCVLVPDDWEYTERAAQILLSMRETNNSNNYGEYSRREDGSPETGS